LSTVGWFSFIVVLRGTFRCELFGGYAKQLRLMMEQTCIGLPIVIIQFAKINSFGGLFSSSYLLTIYSLLFSIISDLYLQYLAYHANQRTVNCSSGGACYKDNG